MNRLFLAGLLVLGGTIAYGGGLSESDLLCRTESNVHSVDAGSIDQMVLETLGRAYDAVLCMSLTTDGGRERKVAEVRFVHVDSEADSGGSLRLDNFVRVYKEVNSSGEWRVSRTFPIQLVNVSQQQTPGGYAESIERKVFNGREVDYHIFSDTTDDE